MADTTYIFQIGTEGVDQATDKVNMFAGAVDQAGARSSQAGGKSSGFFDGIIGKAAGLGLSYHLVERLLWAIHDLIMGQP